MHATSKAAGGIPIGSFEGLSIAFMLLLWCQLTCASYASSSIHHRINSSSQPLKSKIAPQDQLGSLRSEQTRDPFV